MKANLTLLLSALCLLLGTGIWSSCSIEETASYRIGVSQCSDDAWRNKLNEEMQRELLFHPGVSLEVRSADDNNQRQADDIDYFIAQGVDLLIVSPNRADSLTPAVSRAFDAGIPVIVADRKVTGEKYTAFVGGDNLAVGHLQGRYLQMVLPEGGEVLEVLGLPGSTPQELRHQGFMEALAGKEERYVVHQCMGAWFQQQSEEETERMLRAHPGIRVILAQNDQMAIGASRAVANVGMDHRIFIMGVDGLTGRDNGIEAIADGRIDASAVYATGGDLIIQTAVSILEGLPFERNTELPTYLIDKESAPLINNIYKEVEHETETVKMLKDRVDAYWQQHNLERTLLGVTAAFLFLSLVFLVIAVRNYNQKHRLNTSLNHQKELMKEQRDQLAQQNCQLKQLTAQVEEATKAKLMFFTNVSHDFRTPLTLIAAPIEQLLLRMKDDDGSAGGSTASPSPDTATREETRGLLQLAQKNVQVLLRLVNQILDFRKYESGKLEINLSPIDLREALQAGFDSFLGLARKKHIHMEMQVEEGDYRTKADPQKTERIFFNLMGNAFKFTPENGRITVTLSQADVAIKEGTLPQSCIVVRIADTGPGINVEHIRHIFDNFYQIDSAHHEGSGIGLAVVKTFVEMHGGRIDVGNQPTGTGTIFTIAVPRVALTDTAEVREVSPRLTSADVETELGNALDIEEIPEGEQKPVLLVIDDNSDIRQYLQMLLGERFSVVTARDGQEGIRKAMRLVPDVIVCDMMMPGMDGISCCHRLKHEVNTSHIPVLMLTANSLDEQRIQGLTEGGADAYMAKPFNAAVLQAQLRALVDNHNRVKDFFGAGYTHAPARPSQKGEEAHPNSSLDDRFLAKVRKIIDERLSDSDFGVEQLGDIVGMSRAQLYRKVKALTNYSPVELIRNTRLKRAQQMLAQGDETIAQVAYSVGFTAPSYFTKCYKEYFGEMPNELVKRKG